MKISIITVAVNSSSTIADTMQSVLAQDYGDYEHIIVDGGSTDGTIDIIKRLEPLYQGKLRWVSEPDGGLYEAMNKGIAMAAGDIIGTLNSDDFFTSCHVLSMVSEGIDGVDAIYGDIHYVHPSNLSKCVRYYSSAYFRPWMMRMGFMPAHPSFYCRREVYERHGMFDPDFHVAADFELMLRLIFLNHISYRYLPFDMVTMRTGGLSNSGFRSHRRILSDHFNAYRKNNVHSNFLFESVRYVSRLFEVAVSRLFHRKSTDNQSTYKPINDTLT
ncbi:MAG: glycosyltransferase [Muribaculaceae bacterium]|nr:glycosyltransferase [Muribaculaceae bacterium]